MKEKDKKVFHLMAYKSEMSDRPSCWGWKRKDEIKSRFKWLEKRFSYGEAAYLGLIDIARYVSRGSHLLISIDSERFCRELNDRNIQEDENHPLELRNKFRAIVRRHDLDVEVRYDQGNTGLHYRWFMDQIRKRRDEVEDWVDEEEELDEPIGGTTRQLRVSHIPHDATPANLAKWLGKHFHVKDVMTLERDKTGEFEAIVSVYKHEEDDIEEAVYYVNGQTWRGRKIVVELEDE